jgi:hypothetical protein
MKVGHQVRRSLVERLKTENGIWNAGSDFYSTISLK